jgi:hypothetical protein
LRSSLKNSVKNFRPRISFPLTESESVGAERALRAEFNLLKANCMHPPRIHLIFCSSRSERAKRRRLEIILFCKKALLNYCSGGRRVAFSSNFLCFCLGCGSHLGDERTASRLHALQMRVRRHTQRRIFGFLELEIETHREQRETSDLAF